MEHIVEAGTLRRLKLVRDVTDALKNLERPVELRTQLSTTGDIQ
jgi:hypothetical protein